jgi:serine/threonine-protein kinase HipA
MEARYASYRELADIVRRYFANPGKTLEELYKRLIFNVLIGNTDDHARNHAAFWNGSRLDLTPAYDICPQPRVGQEATQAMAIDGDQGNRSNLVNVLSVCPVFQLEQDEAKDMINAMTAVIEDHWTRVCDEAQLVAAERARLWRQAVLNPYCFYGWQ